MEENNNIWVLGHHISPVEVSGNYDMVIGTTPPKVPGPPPHYHTGFNELFMVLEGEMQFVVDGQQRLLKKGESIDLPPNVLHTFRNGGDAPCKWANIHSPKGFMSFFKDVGIAENEPDAVQKSIDDQVIQKVMATAANYDMHIKI